MPCISFSFLDAVARTSNTLLIEGMMKVVILVLFLILEEKLLAFHHWVKMLLWVLSYVTSIMLRHVASLLSLVGDFKIIEGCWILSKTVYASIVMKIWFLAFINVVYHIDLQMLSYPCIPEINPS